MRSLGTRIASGYLQNPIFKKHKSKAISTEKAFKIYCFYDKELSYDNDQVAETGHHPFEAVPGLSNL
jgi:hypothetical protein